MALSTPYVPFVDRQREGRNKNKEAVIIWYKLVIMIVHCGLRGCKFSMASYEMEQAFYMSVESVTTVLTQWHFGLHLLLPVALLTNTVINKGKINILYFWPPGAFRGDDDSDDNNNNYNSYHLLSLWETLQSPLQKLNHSSLSGTSWGTCFAII